MCDKRAKTRCVQCELVQWADHADHANCRRCGYALPAPIANIVERVIEKVAIQQDSECLENLLEASKLISATASKLQESRAAIELPIHAGPVSNVEPFPTLDAMERAMIVAAYRKSNRKPVEAARLLGIGKTTFYRKLKAIRTGSFVRLSPRLSNTDPQLDLRQQGGHAGTPSRSWLRGTN